MSPHKIAYLELPATDLPTTKTFYSTVFGWSFQDFGPDYASISGAGLDAGLNADPGSRPAAPLPIIETADLEAMLNQVQQAGGRITVPIFPYPGGRRFHFLDPSGNELAVLQSDPGV